MFTELLDIKALGSIYNFLATFLLSDFKIDKALKCYNSPNIKVLSTSIDSNYKLTIFILVDSIKENKKRSIQDLANNGIIDHLSIYKISNNKDCAFIKLLNKKLTVFLYSDEDEIISCISRLEDYFSVN